MVSKKYLRTVTAALAVGAMLLAGGCSSNKEEKPVESTPAAESPAPVDESPAAEPPVEEPVTAGLLTAGDKIAVSMPWQGTQNFKEAVEQFPAALEGAGWTNAGVLDANNKAETQQQQIQQFIADGAKAIIIGAVDGKQLSAVVEDAKAQGIVILGYDRLIEGTEAVDGVVQYGSIATGKKEAEALVQGLQEKVSPDGPWTIELFAGGPSDPNAKFFFDGAMEVLQPLIDAGQIKVGSGQVDFETVATPDWDNGKAQTRMDSLLTGNYAGGKSPDGVLAPNDGIARAIITSCENAGAKVPVVDGLDAEDESVKLVREGKQYATVAKPTADLINRTLEVLNALTTSTEMPPADETTDNGKKEVNLYTLDPTIVTQANVDQYFPAKP